MSFIRRRAWASAIWSCGVVWLVSGSSAHAGGLELLPGGTHSVGRGGAIVARPSNPMTVLQNPAGLSYLAGDQLMLDFDTAFHSMCYEPYGYYGWGVYLPDDRAGAQVNLDARRSEFGDPASKLYSERHLDSVCNSAPAGPIPNVAFAYHLTDALSIGFGFVAPVLVPGTQYGGKDGTIAVDDPELPSRPTPTRYQMVNSELLFGLSAVVGASYKIIPELSVGLGFQFASGSGRNNAVMALQAGTSPADDMFVSVKASDYFVPSLVFSVLAKPIPRLTLTGTFNWNDSIYGSGDVTFTTNTYHEGATGSEFVPLENDPIKLRSVRVERPWSATLGARYAQPLPGQRSGDPLDTEIWDVEVDATYTFLAFGGRDNAIDIGEEIVLEVARANGQPEPALRVDKEDIEGLTVETHQLNSMVVRVGGSYNPLPGRLGLSAGAFYESRGVEPAYATIESFAFGRVGVGLGVQLRFGSIDFSAAYAHIFQETVDVAPPPHQPREGAAAAPAARGSHRRSHQRLRPAHLRGRPADGRPEERSIGTGPGRWRRDSQLAAAGRVRISGTPAARGEPGPLRRELQCAIGSVRVPFLIVSDRLTGVQTASSKHFVAESATVPPRLRKVVSVGRFGRRTVYCALGAALLLGSTCIP